jgi:glycosyltransferase involved in cell wall biosynthesis
VSKVICIITHSHLCRNPRVLKESIALARAGYIVEIINSGYSAKLFAEDFELIKAYNIKVQTISDLSKNNWKSFKDRMLKKAGGWLVRYLHIENPYAIGYGVLRYLRVCKNSKADLYICHQELPLYVGIKLKEKGYNIAFDLEDWYSEDLLPESRKERPTSLLKEWERKALHTGSYCTTTSQALANELSKRYSCKAPGVIYNSFSSRADLGNTKKEYSSPIKLFWFSQTIGQGRGLEGFIDLLKNVTISCELHLLGAVSKGYKNILSSSISKPHSIFFHHLVGSDELSDFIKQFDVGLALELKQPLSRNFTITNKLFQYIQAGLPVIASDTTGQREIFKNSKPGLLITNENVTKELNSWLSDPKELSNARDTAIHLSTQYCWETQEEIFLDLVNNAL